MKQNAKILEIFPSIQGEGPYLGERQIFIRFAGCNLSCIFCDVAAEIFPEVQYFSPEELSNAVKNLEAKSGPFHSLSLTGGEPLLQVEFLKEFLDGVKKNKIYLETNGTLPDKLEEVIERIDFISLDFKLPSSAGMKSCWELHRRFLKIARVKKTFVKLILTDKTTPEDFKKAVEIINDIDKTIPLVLQPVTAVNGFRDEISPQKLLFFQREALKFLGEVKIIPQLHKVLGVR